MYKDFKGEINLDCKNSSVDLFEFAVKMGVDTEKYVPFGIEVLCEAPYAVNTDAHVTLLTREVGTYPQKGLIPVIKFEKKIPFLKVMGLFLRLHFTVATEPEDLDRLKTIEEINLDAR